MIAAARLGCRSVRGIEIAPVLTEIASRNVAQLRTRTRPKVLEVITGDATAYGIPDDVNRAVSTSAERK
jgi:hypothetical protein